MVQNQEFISLIQNHIAQQGGAIRFSDFMDMALYAPGYGYYKNSLQKFGSEGDFVTAPELGPLFAKCLSRQCLEIFAHLPQKNILEIGAGSGQLASDLIDELKDDLDSYYVLEVSGSLRERQSSKNPRIQHLDTLPENFSGIIIANEVLDAMPASRFYFNKNHLQEYYVTPNLEYSYGAPSAALTKHFTNKEIANYIGDDYSSEINLWLAPWIKSLHDSLSTGAVLIFDYGFPRREYYHPDRNTGTLMCHHQHRCHFDPFHLPGQQDITAHVDFTHVAEAANDNELEVAGFTNLSGFLLGNDITHFVKDSLRQAAEVNTLTSPAEMGELFKAMCLVKDLDIELQAFSDYDRLYTL